MPVRDTATVSSGNAASRPPGRKEAESTLGQPVAFHARYITAPSVHAPSFAMRGVQQSTRSPETSVPPMASRWPASNMTAVTVAVRLPSSSAAAADSGFLLKATFSKLQRPRNEPPRQHSQSPPG